MTDTDPARERYIAELYRALQAGSQDYDRAVLSLASGTLALSATFIHDIAPAPVGSSVTLLALSWAALLASIVANVASLLLSQLGLRRLIEEMEAGKTPTKLGGPLAWTNWLNLAAGAALILGLGLFGLFAVVNLRGGS